MGTEADDPYAHAAKSKLKLKGDCKIKKKKKKDKNFLEKAARTIEVEEVKETQQEKRTKAELAFKKMQEKMVSYKPHN